MSHSSGAMIKDTLLPPNRNNKLLDSRKSAANLLKHTSSAPSLHAIASKGSTSLKNSPRPKAARRSSNYR